jgi:hypothetical protein
MQRLAFLSALAAIGFVAVPALAEDTIHVEHAPNPGFAYELTSGPGAGIVTVRIRNSSSATLTVFRTFPSVENRFDVVDVDQGYGHPSRRHDAPPAIGRVTSNGSALEPGETSEAQVDLHQLFVLVPGHRYRVKAQTQLRFGPSDRIVVTALRSNETTVGN